MISRSANWGSRSLGQGEAAAVVVIGAGERQHTDIPPVVGHVDGAGVKVKRDARLFLSHSLFLLKNEIEKSNLFNMK
ncbi:hypothetical protein EAE92_23345 [Photorhabdus hainanensis]|nr:hypothetical protein [Photorhabdus hainanensis]